jgi:hypothetical protein
MQNQVDNVVKGMIPEQLGPQLRKVTLHVFMCKILANRIQVSDVAPGPLVLFYGLLENKECHDVESSSVT